MSDPFDLYRRALTHKSYAEEFGTAFNERLEFLGDAVLQLAISEMLFETFPDDAEGALSDRRKQLVQNQTLAEVARELQLPSIARLGRGEQLSSGRGRQKFQADLVESLLGAIYLDQGWSVARAAIRARWADRLHAAPATAIHPKVALQELVQARFQEVPEYRDEAESGPSHKPTFEVSVWIRGVEFARAEGGSKKIAERAAAAVALRRLREHDAGGL